MISLNIKYVKRKRFVFFIKFGKKTYNKKLVSNTQPPEYMRFLYFSLIRLFSYKTAHKVVLYPRRHCICNKY